MKVTSISTNYTSLSLNIVLANGISNKPKPMGVSYNE